ncbi:DUF4242 domain-containing protein [Streptomyces turgidiscabies]|uniref:DUF4242 domain-containing protein n=1 Tax=Streptomyces turgidiscabies (strain Car8) TaxID=698760 RepID=L7F929_STRT8|nr:MULTISPECIES: DUF4242 domain-containing protein [Streptomyces]ELP67561.1 hypothetical protein STRTUCAR8_10075 [Streptomyces turgidiscabies Car8]MDX3496640.1 DUF4242 domain-containing protein [Streptomyces turgidiscabies]GAQ72838.1 hypothetical protein T45_04593 [Streptomyces turgidiscabies]
MPRYLVQRTFSEGLHIPMNDEGAKACTSVIEGNAASAVTWVQSYVSRDKSVTYCVYDGPSPEAVRQAAQTTGLPVDQITEVSVLDPYFYH